MGWKPTSNLSDEERAQHEKDYGKYNDFPRNWREISDADMAKSLFFTYSPQLVEHRQMIYPWGVDRKDHDRRQGMTSAQLFFMHDGSGFGLVNDFWGGTIQWFEFDGPCDHEMKVTRSQMCYTESTCVHCGYHEAIDSSG